MKVCFNGEFFPVSQPLFTAQNRSFKWGDGLFETMKFHQGRLLLADLHFERLFLSLRLLQIECPETFIKTNLLAFIASLCKQNGCVDNARVRLAVYRDELNKAQYVIEAIPLQKQVNEWQEEGLRICLYPYTRKAMDALANVKSANYLPYVLAGKYAAEEGFDDAIVLNAQNLLCDSSKANLFIISGNALWTPALHQGCINGVMRRVVIDQAKSLGYKVRQDEVSEDQLLHAEEVFLTNAIQMVRWVKTYRERTYNSAKTRKIFDAVSSTIFSSSC
jgi:branched-chain amino acid aminotransferase